MTFYTFDNLSPLDFETLAIDLLQKYKNISLIETFKQGKDQGIDGRFFTDKKETIVQCKRYKNYSDLVSHITRIESNKVKNIAPDNYILVTSCPLSTTQKKELFSLLKNYVKNNVEVLGNEDINNLIRQYPEIEYKHSKLWLNNINILEKVLHSQDINESEIIEKKIKNKVEVYVENQSLSEALEILNEKSCCVISGEPGVGKTTLAEMSSFYYMERGYRFSKISSNIREGYKFLRSKNKTIFYYDDFLGTTFLESKLEKNEDSKIISFLEEISSKNNPHKIILTTREYILQQAYDSLERLSSSNLDMNKYVLKLDKYTDYNKAKILYNHLFFSSIGTKYIKSFLDNRAYLNIIRHKNFNPRSIETMTEINKLKNVTPSEYSKYFIENLDNPEQIWRHAFNQLSAVAQYLILTIASFKGNISLGILEDSYTVLKQELSKKHQSKTSLNDFTKSLKELEGSFISTKRKQNYNRYEIYVKFINPAISDFIEEYLCENKNLFTDLLNHSKYIEQISKLLNLSCEKKVFKSIFKSIKSKILKIKLAKKNAHFLEFNPTFSIVFKNSTEKMIGQNNDFFKNFSKIFWSYIEPPMWKQSISLVEAIDCLKIFEEKQTLYFENRELLLERAKVAFCTDIDGQDLIIVKEFLNSFSFIDEETKENVDDQACSYIDETFSEYKSSYSSSEMREVAEELAEIESAYGFESGLSNELESLAQEQEQEYADYDENGTGSYGSNRNHIDIISDRELESMFNTLRN